MREHEVGEGRQGEREKHRGVVRKRKLVVGMYQSPEN